MARPLRIQFPNAVYHITCRGIRKDRIFFADRDRLKFLSVLNETAVKYGFVLHAFCLMPNHYHAFLRTQLANLSRGIHELNSAYANWLRCKRKLVGHIFQGRFKSILVDTETYAINLSIYIHLNPCRWGLTKQPEDYAWSSCRDYLGLREEGRPALDPSPILGSLGRECESARAAYLALMRERRDMDDPLKQSFRRIALGSPSFVDRIRQLINERASGRNIREYPVRTIEQCRALTPAQVFDAMSTVTGCSVPEILGKRRGRPWRAMGMYMVKRYCAIGLRQAGALWGVDYTSISRTAKEFSIILARDEELGRQITKVEALLAALRRQDLPLRLPEEKANSQGSRLAF